MAERPDFTFGAARWSPDTVLSADPSLRKRSGRRDLRAKVPRNLPAISAPERNVARSIADTGAGALSSLLGGDERERVQRASRISDALSLFNPVEGLERAFVHGYDQLQGGQPVGTADYVNFALPAATLAAGPALRAAGKMVPPGVKNWLTASRAMPEVDDAVLGQFAARETPQLAARPMPQVRALPAPPERLPLPNYYDPLPDYAVKRRGGQWLPPDVFEPNIVEDGSFITSGGVAPERLIGRIAPRMRYSEETISANPALAKMNARKDWLERNLAKYIKNEMGTPDDPLRLLDEQGIRLQNNYRDGVPWHEATGYSIDPIPFGSLVGPGAPQADTLLRDYPWMAKQPVTDQIYGLHANSLEDLGFSHLNDELANMLGANSGLPEQFRLRPESLQRLSVPDAVRRVHELGQWRMAQAAEANASLANNPAVHVLKEYPDDPRGLRWVELKQPSKDALPEGWYPDGSGFYNDATGDYHAVHPALEDALRYEGDQMGHCVGGYCDDVASGHSRIFSLRDAKGQPHVTIETAPGVKNRTRNDIPAAEADRLAAQATEDLNRQIAEYNLPVREGSPKWTQTWNQSLDLLQREWLRNNPAPENIIQIKGKGNRAPIEDYLPHVQDFVKSQGPWGEIGDLRNTGLRKLPDGRFVTQQQWAEGMNKAFGAGAEDLLGQRDLYGDDWWRQNWPTAAPHFEGFARGGRVSRHYLAAR